jgi:predicted nucleic acid-binding protein
LTAVVVDASVCAKWVLLEDHTTEARGLLLRDCAFLAPDLVLCEVACVLWKRVRRGELSAADAGDVLTTFLDLPLRTYSHGTLIPRGLQIGLETGRSVYDSLYIALAESQECMLVTADRRLYNSTRSGPYAHRIAWVQDEL